MVNKSELKKVVESLFHALNESNELIGMAGEESILHPGVTEGEIEAFEEKVGRRFPPSYRTFLSLHNGWEEYRNVFTLVGTSGKHTEEAIKDINQTIHYYNIKWEGIHGKATEENIKKFESVPVKGAKTEEEARLYMPTKLHFGTDFAGSLFYFNPNETNPDGEMEVVYRNQVGEIVGRYPNFFELLKANLLFYEKKIARLKAKQR